MCPVKRRYHRDIGFPAGTLLRPPSQTLYYKHHALLELDADGVLPFRPFDLPDDAVCIEVSMAPDGVTVWRWVMRMPILPQQDLVLVIEVDGTVVTGWVNGRTDTHRSLDHSIYTRPQLARPGYAQ